MHDAAYAEVQENLNSHHIVVEREVPTLIRIQESPVIRIVRSGSRLVELLLVL